MKPYRLPRGFFLIFLFVVLLLMGGVTWFFFAQRQLLKENIDDDLLTIAEGKVEQIVTWRRDQIDEGRELMQNQFLLREIAEWQETGSLENVQEIRSFFYSIQKHYRYKDVILASPQGQPLISLKNDLASLDFVSFQLLGKAIDSGEPLLTDLHIGAHDQNPHISLIAPLYFIEGDSQKTLGAIILINDARDFLYPLIQSWPTESESAETLLVKKDGDTVLYLNDLRHQKGTALNLRFNLSEREIPAVNAIFGVEGIFTGIDYRGIEVLSALMPIPDSPWFIVAKVDSAEALAVWRTNSALIVAMLLGILGIATAAAVVFWQRDEKRHYFKLAAIETAHRES